MESREQNRPGLCRIGKEDAVMKRMKILTRWLSWYCSRAARTARRADPGGRAGPGGEKGTKTFLRDRLFAVHLRGPVANQYEQGDGGGGQTAPGAQAGDRER